MKRRVKMWVLVASVLVLVFTINLGVASAHTTDDAAADTPLGGQSRSQDGALDGYGGAVEDAEAGNSLVRNPTCGAHNGADGIHPPGNP